MREIYAKVKAIGSTPVICIIAFNGNKKEDRTVYEINKEHYLSSEEAHEIVRRINEEEITDE